VTGHPVDCMGQETPASAAFRVYRDRAGGLGSRPVAVVEGGYFDRREGDALDRQAQLADSFRLVRYLSELPELHRPEVVLAALVNDLSTSRACGLDFCEGGPLDPPVAADRLPGWARAIYDEHRAESPWPLHTFSLKTTRNRVIRWLRRQLLPSRSESSPLLERKGPGYTEIYAEGDLPAPLLLARRRQGFRIAARCSALIAQHYFDLFRRASKLSPDLTDLWIFDFDHPTEKYRVAAGAEASFALFPWPRDVRVRVANCIYDPSDARVPPVQLTERP
jgi:hypothetical protein